MRGTRNLPRCSRAAAAAYTALLAFVLLLTADHPAAAYWDGGSGQYRYNVVACDVSPGNTTAVWGSVNNAFDQIGDPLVDIGNGCPSDGSSEGSGGGLWAHVQNDGVGSTAAINDVAYFRSKDLPAGNRIAEWQVVGTTRATVSDGGGESKPHWEAALFSERDTGHYTFAGCYSLGTTDDCYSNPGGSAVNYPEAILLGGASGVYKVGIKLRCASPPCTNVQGKIGKSLWQGRANMRYSSIVVRDTVDPSGSATARDWNDGWYSGGVNLTITGNASDNTGILAYEGLVDDSSPFGPVDLWSGCGNQRVLTAGAQRDNWYLMGAGCSTSSGSINRTISTDSLSDGTHSIKLRFIDVSGRPLVTNGWNVNIDRTVPGAGGSCATGASTAAPATTADAGTGRSYVSKDPFNVTGTACDPTSGIAASKVEYQLNGGAWSTLCNGGTAGGGGTVNLSCSFDPRPQAEGTRVNFRVVATDAAGNTTYSSATSDAYIDSTPPTITGSVTFNNGTGTYSTLSANGWHNGRNITANWGAASRGSGASVSQVLGRHDKGSCGTYESLSAAAATTSWVLTDAQPGDADVACQQGDHNVLIWARDANGNESQSAPYSKSAVQRLDTFPRNGVEAQTGFTPMRPTALTVTPSGYANVKTAFSAQWTNPIRTDITREAPIRDARWTLAGSAVQSTSSCITDGQTCTLANAAIQPLIPDQGGEYPLKLWLRDEAGNEDDTLNRVGVIRYNPQACRLN